MWRNAKECSPSNNEKVIVELSDGSYTLAWQRFGEWEDVLSPWGYDHDDVVRWRYATRDDFEQIRQLLREKNEDLGDR